MELPPSDDDLNLLRDEMDAEEKGADCAAKVPKVLFLSASTRPLSWILRR